MDYNIKIMTQNYEYGLIETINKDVLEIFDDIVLMPNTHIGKDVPIGFTGKFNDKIIPSVVGVDIGCGMSIYQFPKINIDWEEFESKMRELIPTGFAVHDEPQTNWNELKNLKISDNIDENRVLCSIGTLGRGNHFIEIDQNEEHYFLVVHSGSRSLGAKVFDNHQEKIGTSKNLLKKNTTKNYQKSEKNSLVKRLEKKYLN